MLTADNIPDELRLSADKQTLSLVFGTKRFDLTAEYLRVCSPSAEVRGHGAESWKTVAGKAGISIYKIAPVGNYAVQIVFSDAHASGIYTWQTLYELAEKHDFYWSRYLQALEREGKSRTPHQNRASIVLPQHLQRTTSGVPAQNPPPNPSALDNPPVPPVKEKT